ncbi:splicing factor, suppressor of white-apricot homolog isoform X2 [Rhineura floridana]|uniref:splicing factor, suppressor of white-apricot homolog isoform X2 n=1 Tax=Rhineura floridana TaxID=261503 RepID=UPI002AC889E3|nr:splicing factor, suppressor of white-apricot homolog isoform X2 [Rhineura floridana]
MTNLPQPTEFRSFGRILPPGFLLSHRKWLGRHFVLGNGDFVGAEEEPDGGEEAVAVRGVRQPGERIISFSFRAGTSQAVSTMYVGRASAAEGGPAPRTILSVGAAAAHPVAAAGPSGSGGSSSSSDGAGGSGSSGGRVELLVFGYACKLFRDDEKALQQEQGRHLIPWMGEPSIMIDRYDGRGHLHDLSEYDAEYSTWNRDYQLSEEEARIEALCDEERYLALRTDLLEEEARQEEEYKRLSEALAEDGTYNAVGFTYSSDYYDPSEPTEEEEQPSKAKGGTTKTENVEENEEPFIAPLGLNVPSDVELPPTAKMHAIIERTANFVCKQGAQFEIMLKAKQARNSQFDFLRFDHYLNPYYKFIQKAMKEGRYAAPSEKKKEEEKNAKDTGDEDDDDDDDGDNYLHPSLFASKKCSRLEELMKPLKVVDPDHPLAALVRKAQAENNLAASQPTEGGTVQSSQVEYSSDSTVAAMYYSYYMLPDGSYCLAPPPPGIDMATYYNALPAGVTVSSTTGVATITAPPPPPGTTPPPSSEATDDTSGVIPATTNSTSTIPSVVAIIPPPPDIQPVIDKLAEYVARNGIKFETSVRAKNDPRFEFLQPWHQYNAYYEFKKQFFLQKEASDSSKVASLSEDVSADTADTVGGEAEFPTDQTSEDVESTDEGNNKKDPIASKILNDGKLVKASFAPISFAIRAKENDMLPLEKNRVKLDDDSDEEGEEGKEGQENASSTSNSHTAFAMSSTAAEEKKPQLTQEELEAKQAKQKLEDRLAAAAREKLAQASKESKEKQLQAERKRKAALFLQNLKNPLADSEVEKMEEHAFNIETVSNMPCPLLTGIRTLPTLEVKAPERPSSKGRDLPREEEREKKKKKHKKRSRSRSQSPPSKYHSSSKSRSRTHSKAKHSLPTAYRTVRHSRLSESTGTLSMEPWFSSPSVGAAAECGDSQAASTAQRYDCRSSLEGNPGKASRSRSRSPRRRAHTPERRREERCVPTAYRVSNSPGMSRRRAHSRSPHEKKKRRSHSHTKSKARSHSPSVSPGKPSAHKNSTHSASVSPVESRGSSQERSGGVSLEKDGQISSAIVSSVQSKITQDLMAKVRAMLAASKNIPTSAS